jgi:hypothetical protein
VNLEALFQEIDGLEARGADTSKLRVSANAHLVAPYHQVLDKVTERFLGSRAWSCSTSRSPTSPPPCGCARGSSSPSCAPGSTRP